MSNHSLFDELEKDLEKNPRNMRVRRLLIELYSLSGDNICKSTARDPSNSGFKLAIIWWERAVSLFLREMDDLVLRNSYNYARLAFVYELLGNSNRAIEYAERILITSEEYAGQFGTSHFADIISATIQCFSTQHETLHEDRKTFYDIFIKAAKKYTQSFESNSSAGLMDYIGTWENILSGYHWIRDHKGKLIDRYFEFSGECILNKYLYEPFNYAAVAYLKLAEYYISIGKAWVAVRYLNRAISFHDQVTTDMQKKFIARCKALLRSHETLGEELADSLVYFHRSGLEVKNPGMKIEKLVRDDVVKDELLIGPVQNTPVPGLPIEFNS